MRYSMSETNISPSLEALSEAVVRYERYGYHCIPLKPGKKRPSDKGWNRILPNGVSRFSEGQNCGLLMGTELELSGAFSCAIDIDSIVASQISSHILPQTKMKGGSSTAHPSNHWFFRTKKPLPTLRFKYEQTTLVEVLGRGSQILVEPSIHPRGSTYVLEGLGKSAIVDAEVLIDASLRLALHTLALTLCANDVSVYTEVMPTLDMQPFQLEQQSFDREMRQKTFDEIIKECAAWLMQNRRKLNV